MRCIIKNANDNKLTKVKAIVINDSQTSAKWPKDEDVGGYLANASSANPRQLPTSTTPTSTVNIPASDIHSVRRPRMVGKFSSILASLALIYD